jgi:hypothetical protein
MDQNEEEIKEIEFELVDFTKSMTWLRVMKPALEKRQKDIQRQLAIGCRMELEEIRQKQFMYKFISELLENPIKFFSFR